MPQYLPFNETNVKEIFNFNVTGDFSSLATIPFGATSAPIVSDNIVSLAMDKATEAYSLDTFEMTITNEYNTTADGTITILLQISTSGTLDTTATWTTIGTATSVNGVTPTVTLTTTAIPVGTYVRIRPTSFGTVTPSFHVEVNGKRF